MRCPVCRQVSLERETYEGFNLHKCPQCLGVLIPRLRADGITRNVKDVPRDLEQEVLLERGADTRKLLSCTKCGNHMQKLNKSRPTPFQIDHCRKCDVYWMDGGELAMFQLSYEGTAQAEEAQEMKRRFDEMTDEQRAQLRANIRKLPQSDLQNDAFAVLIEVLIDGRRY